MAVIKKLVLVENEAKSNLYYYFAATLKENFNLCCDQKGTKTTLLTDLHNLTF